MRTSRTSIQKVSNAQGFALVQHARAELARADAVRERIAAIAQFEKDKAEQRGYADAMLDRFMLRGSNRPADDPMQAGLF